MVLRNIGLTIPKNKIMAIIGPSGCGKSTLLRAINKMNNLIPSYSSEGAITVFDREYGEAQRELIELRSAVGMVFQKPSPFPRSVRGNIEYGLKIHGVKDKKVIEKIIEKTLKEAGLWEEVKDNLQQNATSLSGGQQQRLCIARTLALKPKIILMDEPCSALDPISTSIIESLMVELSKSYTIILVTHNMQQAARISDYTAFLLNGHLIEVNETGKLFENPESQLTEQYITGRFG